MCIHYKDEMQKMYGALIEHLEYQARARNYWNEEKATYNSQARIPHPGLFDSLSFLQTLQSFVYTLLRSDHIEFYDLKCLFFLPCFCMRM